MCVEKLIWQSDGIDNLASISGLCQISAYAHNELPCEIYLAKQLCCLVLGYLALMGGSRSEEIVKSLR